MNILLFILVISFTISGSLAAPVIYDDYESDMREANCPNPVIGKGSLVEILDPSPKVIQVHYPVPASWNLQSRSSQAPIDVEHVKVRIIKNSFSGDVAPVGCIGYVLRSGIPSLESSFEASEKVNDSVRGDAGKEDFSERVRTPKRSATTR